MVSSLVGFFVVVFLFFNGMPECVNEWVSSYFYGNTMTNQVTSTNSSFSLGVYKKVKWVILDIRTFPYREQLWLLLLTHTHVS